MKGLIIILRLKDLTSKHKVTLYATDGKRFNIICDNMLDAQKFADGHMGYRYTPGYTIEKVQKTFNMKGLQNG